MIESSSSLISVGINVPGEKQIKEKNNNTTIPARAIQFCSLLLYHYFV
jgi:hypothetical protein